MEVVELGRSDDAAHEGMALEMLSRAETHRVHAVFPRINRGWHMVYRRGFDWAGNLPHLCDNLLAWSLPGLFDPQSLGPQVLIHEYPRLFP